MCQKREGYGSGRHEVCSEEMSFKFTREGSGSVCAILRWTQADGWREDLTFNNITQESGGALI